MVTLSPAPAVDDPIASMSIVISASSAIEVSDITAAVAAVVEVFSPASIVSLVERIVDPDSLISTVSADPTGAVVTEALTAVIVAAEGIRNVALAVPVVKSDVSSEQATVRLRAGEFMSSTTRSIVPSASWYVADIPVSVLLLNIAPTMS